MKRKNRVGNKNKLSRIDKLKRRRRKKRIRTFILLTTITFLFIYLFHTLYVKNKSKDLQYAVEHSLTSGSSKNRLLRVQNISLIFNDNKNAIVEVSGLSKNQPHTATKIKGTFKKDLLNSWKLEESKKIEN